MDGFQVDDGGMTSKVEHIFPEAQVARAASLLSRQMREHVLDFYALAQAFAPRGRDDELSQAMLELLIVGNREGSPGTIRR